MITTIVGYMVVFLGEISAKYPPNLPRGDILSSGGGVAWGVWIVLDTIL